MKKVSIALAFTLFFAIVAISKAFSGSSGTAFFDLRSRRKALWDPVVG